MVQLVLESKADPFSGEDLLMITEIVRQSHATAHISHGTWQILVGVSRKDHHAVTQIFQARGYECYVFSGETKEHATFVLRKRGISG